MELAARVNGVLDGELGKDSFTLSQSFYVGQAETVFDKKSGKTFKCKPLESDFHTGTRFIDQCSDLDVGAIYWKADAPDRQHGTGPKEPMGASIEQAVAITAALDPVWRDSYLDKPGKTPEAPKRLGWFSVASAWHHEFGGSMEAFEALDKLSQGSKKYNRDNNLTKWERHFNDDHPNALTMRSLNAAIPNGHPAKINEYEQTEEEIRADFDVLEGKLERDARELIGGEDDEPRRRLQFLSPADCAVLPTRQYVWKGILAAGDVGCIFGAPGAGKSLIAPFLAYKVAQGEPAFDMRTKQGGALYISAEDQTGMQMRVTALRNQHGEADGLNLVCGVSDLLSEGSPNLRELQHAVAELKPALIVIDTLAMAFPGLEENSAEAMSRVIRVCRLVAKHGAAVLLIHHDTKANGGTPRGHSVLNGALDMAMRIEQDADGIVRAKLTKNRNGPCNIDIAFKIAVETLGEDADGDSITAAYCQPCDGCGGERLPGLTETEADIWHVIRDAASSGMTSKEWRREYIRRRDGEPSDTVRKAWRRGVKGLLLKKRVIKEGSRFFDAKSRGELEDQFDEGDDELI